MTVERACPRPMRLERMRNKGAEPTSERDEGADHSCGRIGVSAVMSTSRCEAGTKACGLRQAWTTETRAWLPRRSELASVRR